MVLNQMSDKLSADDVLNNLDKSNPVILKCILVCGLAWIPLSLTGLSPSFLIKSPTNSTFLSVTDEFDLNGDSLWLADTTTTFYMIGNMLGGMFIPPLADRYGRLPVLLITVILLTFCGVLSALSTTILIFCFLRLAHGVFYTASGLAGWVLAYENTPLRLRFFTSVYFGICWVIGACLLSLVAYLSPNWRWMMLAVSAPNILIAILVYSMVPESLHYLVATKNLKKIELWLQTVNTKSDIQAYDIIPTDDERTTSSISELFKDMWKHKTFLIYISAMTYIWIVDTFIYFGLSFYSRELAGNIYLNFVLMSLVEAPAYIFSPLFMNRFGRKFLISGSHIIAGISFLGIVFFPGSFNIIFWLVGKFAISCSFMSIYMFASELFPTDGRNKCIGFCETMSRVGGMLSPYLSHLSAIHPLGPAISLSLISISGGLLTLILPETLNTKLPLTIAESASRRQLLQSSA